MESTDPVEYGKLIAKVEVLTSKVESMDRFALDSLRTAVIAFFALTAFNAYAQDTTINYKGQPPPTAMAPSLSATGQDICAVPISGAVSSTVIDVEPGTLLLFRSALFHSVRPHLGNWIRYSVAFNTIPRGPFGEEGRRMNLVALNAV